jgi:hypothetical protein
MGRLFDAYGNDIPSPSPPSRWRAASKRTKTLVVSALGVIGATALLLGNVSTIRNSLFPDNPKLRVVIFESGADVLYLFPSVDTSVEQTESIPLQLRIENTGGRVAKNVKGYLSYYVSVVVTSTYAKEEKRTWSVPNEAMRQLTLSLPDINPGESLLVPISVRLQFPRDFQRTLYSPREALVDGKLPEPMGYQLNCDISSDASPSTRTSLQIILGRLDILRERTDHVFYMGHGKDGVRVLEAKEDEFR